MNLILVNLMKFVLAQASSAGLEAPVPPTSPLELGYRQMYNLQFEEAHKTFESWEQLHPDDPLGPSSNAAAFLFSEFNRLGILEAELFEDNEKLQKSKIRTPDPTSKKGFERATAKSDQLADAVLKRSPRDPNALFAKVLNQGLRSDYAGLIEKRFLASLGYMKSGRLLATKLLEADPSNYDAYLAIGIENYILGSSPAPVRLFLQLFGSQTNRAQGVEHVRLTAEKGHYLKPFARLMLAVAALRDKNREKARALLEGLALEFPDNPLYSREAARLK